MTEVWHRGGHTALMGVIRLAPAVTLMGTQLGLGAAVRRVRVLNTTIKKYAFKDLKAHPPFSFLSRF